MTFPRTITRAAPRRLLVTLLFLAGLCVFAPRLAPASQRPPAGTVETAHGVARVMLPDLPGPLTVEFGCAPYASKLLRPHAGARAVELPGVVPGGVYVVRVLSNGVPVTRATPFVMPGAPARVRAPTTAVSL